MQFFSVVSFNQHTRNMACLMLQYQMSNGLNESGSYQSTNGAAAVVSIRTRSPAHQGSGAHQHPYGGTTSNLDAVVTYRPARGRLRCRFWFRGEHGLARHGWATLGRRPLVGRGATAATTHPWPRHWRPPALRAALPRPRHGMGTNIAPGLLQSDDRSGARWCGSLV
jgi:hypothetical protein